MRVGLEKMRRGRLNEAREMVRRKVGENKVTKESFVRRQPMLNIIEVNFELPCDTKKAISRLVLDSLKEIVLSSSEKKGQRRRRQ